MDHTSFAISMLYKALTGDILHPQYIEENYTAEERTELHNQLIEIFNEE